MSTENRIVTVMFDFDHVFTNPEDVHKVRVKPTVIKAEKKFTAEAIVALLWMQERGKTHVPGDIDDLIEERRRGLEALGVEDLNELISTTASYLLSDRFGLKKRIETFWRDRTI